MDIKKERRDAVMTGQVWDKKLPEPEGMYPGAGGSSAGSPTKGHGNAASDNNIGWDMRAQSWQRGADTCFMSIQKEKDESDERAGVPHVDSFPAPSDPKGPPNCGAKYQTASYNANDLLPSPANWSNNPGFMATSTGDAATSGNPGNGMTANIATSGGGSQMVRRGVLQGTSADGGRRETSGGVSARAGTLGGRTIGRSPILSRGNVTMPAPSDTDPGAEGGPQVVSSGFSNG